jgi:ribonuclease BN (tRNA processing enzyme)
VLLGTGTPNAEPDRSGPAVAVVVNDTPYLVDCGPGVVRRAVAAHRAGVRGLRVTSLKRLFVTHLHSDHTVGYPDVILTPWVLGRAEPLTVYGPSGIRAMTEHILKAYEQDIDIRLNGLEGAQPNGWKVNVHEIEPGVIYRDANVTVKAFPVKHGSWAHAFGFRFEAPGRTIVISGDTTPTDMLIENAKGCDVLIHEVYSQAGFQGRSPKWRRYHSSFHTSSLELARIAEEVRPGLLVLYHHLLWGTSEEELLNEIRQIYRGQVVFGKDLDVF